MKGPRLSVVLPCFNEEKRVGHTIDSFRAYLGKQDYTSELIVVDDASTDATAQLVCDQFPDVMVLAHYPNRGKGYSAREGYTASRGDYILFSDADGSTPIDELEKFWPKIEQGADVVIGSRALPGARIDVRQPWYRENMGRSYNLLLRLLRLTRFPDTQCGFKLLSRRACETIMPRQTRDGFGADIEWLCIARIHDLRIEQVAVRWINSPDSRVHALFDSAEMIREALNVRWNCSADRYK